MQSAHTLTLFFSLLSRSPALSYSYNNMSRHRAVRNLDLDEELAEDDIYGDEDPYGESRTPCTTRKDNN